MEPCQSVNKARNAQAAAAPRGRSFQNSRGSVNTQIYLLITTFNFSGPIFYTSFVNIITAGRSRVCLLHHLTRFRDLICGLLGSSFACIHMFIFQTYERYSDDHQLQLFSTPQRGGHLVYLFLVPPVGLHAARFPHFWLLAAPAAHSRCSLASYRQKCDRASTIPLLQVDRHLKLSVMSTNVKFEQFRRELSNSYWNSRRFRAFAGRCTTSSTRPR